MAQARLGVGLTTATARTILGSGLTASRAEQVAQRLGDAIRLGLTMPELAEGLVQCVMVGGITARIQRLPSSSLGRNSVPSRKPRLRHSTRNTAKMPPAAKPPQGA